jgi:phenylalanyl-tRNA synthetase beta chain
MNIIKKWLKSLFVTNLSSEKIVTLPLVVVGEILTIEKHPNADRLQKTRVSIGTETLDIVCGAKNIKVGDRVPVALVGANLPNGLEIKAAEIRGEKSFGMLCAADELGLGTDHSGILILEPTTKLGAPVEEYLTALHK